MTFLGFAVGGALALAADPTPALAVDAAPPFPATGQGPDAAALWPEGTAGPPEVAPARPEAAALQRRDALELEDVLAIRRPESPAWAQDGSRIAFLWQDGAATDLWWVEADGQGEPRAVTTLAADGAGRSVTGFDWSPDSRTLAYVLDGDLWEVDVGSGERRRLTRTAAAERSPRFAAAGELAFVRDDGLWVRGTDAALRRAGVWERGRPRRLAWSPDGAWIAVLVEPPPAAVALPLEVPGRRAAAQQPRGTAPDLYVVPASGGPPVGLEQGDEHSGSVAWSSDGAIAWQQVSADARRRRILVAAAPEWRPMAVVDETDDAWWTLTYLDAGPRWEPDGHRVAFLSDRDGWCHLWLVDAAGPLAGAADGRQPPPVQLTRGEYEVEAPAWRPDGDSIVVAANRGSASERGLLLVEVPPSSPSAGAPDAAAPGPPEPISTMRGTSIDARWSPDGRRLAFLHADPRRPLDLWVQEARLAEATQLSDSWPPQAPRDGLVSPLIVRFSSSDGALVPAYLLLPERPARPTPAIVWAHGASRQNRWGWPPSRVDAVFYGLNQLLVQRGFAVLALDYRGSSGYGRRHRVGPWRDLGGADLDDLLAARRYLEALAEPRIGRVGVVGHSYGGYLAVAALTRAPTAFAAGVDVAGVVDWEAWARGPGGRWLAARLGDAYDLEEARRRSPIHEMERLVEPLLVLHGAADRHVPVAQSRQLIDALERQGRPFDAIVYSGEGHGFRRRETWADAFGRIVDLLDRALRR